MGAWGIRERQSDYGLDLLGTIVGTQLKAVEKQIGVGRQFIAGLLDQVVEEPDGG